MVLLALLAAKIMVLYRAESWQQQWLQQPARGALERVFGAALGWTGGPLSGLVSARKRERASELQSFAGLPALLWSLSWPWMNYCYPLGCCCHDGSVLLALFATVNRTGIIEVQSSLQTTHVHYYFEAI